MLQTIRLNIFPVSLICGSEREICVCVCVCVCVHMGACVGECMHKRECVCDEVRTKRQMMMRERLTWQERKRERLTWQESCNWLVYLGDVPLSQPEFQWHYLTVCVCMRACAKERVWWGKDSGERWWRWEREIDVAREWERESCNWLVYSGDVPLSQPEFQWHHTKSASSCAAKHTTKTATLLLHQQAHDQMTALFKVNQQRLKSGV